MDNQTYTDALNATLITYNGNEQMMQNDMGNTMIQDAKTGNIMGLREGFVPVGMKEHGGIIYIASVNKDGEGEIGTIPSPIIEYNQNNKYPFALDLNNLTVNSESGYSDLYPILDKQLKVGDKFVAFIPIENEEYETFSLVNGDPIYVPVIEKLNDNDLIQGIYKIGLYSQASDQIYDLNYLINDCNFSFYTNKGIINAERWFVSILDAELDVDASLAAEQSRKQDDPSPFIVYPKISSGIPSIRKEMNRIDSFSLLPNYTSDDSGEKCYPFTVLKTEALGKLYYMAIPGFKYTTTSGMHPTKINMLVVREDNGDKLYDESDSFKFRYKGENDNVFYLMHVGVDPEEKEEGKDYPKRMKNDFYETVEIARQAVKIPIGKSSNVWFTITADYYYHDIKLGTYTCRFNPYVYDTLKNFKTIQYQPNDNYNGEGNIWFQQYYDINRRSADNLLESFSGSYSSYGGSKEYPFPSGAGISLFSTNKAPQIPAYLHVRNNLGEKQIGYFNKESYPYYNEFDVIKEGSTDRIFQRPGIILKDLLGDTDFEEANSKVNKWSNEKNINYLYTSSANNLQDYSESKLVLTYDLANLGFRLNNAYIPGSDSKEKEKWLDETLIFYSILPTSLKKNITILFAIFNAEKWRYDIYIITPTEGSPLEGTIELEIADIKTLFKEKFINQNNYYEPLFKLYGITTSEGSKGPTIYLDGDPWISRHEHCNDSSINVDLNIVNKLNISEISDYQVVPQINVIYEEDDQLYPGYLGSNGVEEIDVDISKNYLLKDGVSEGNYLLNTGYIPFTATSIYGAGFGYHRIPMDLTDILNPKPVDNVLTKEISLDPGIYIINVNGTVTDSEENNYEDKLSVILSFSSKVYVKEHIFPINKVITSPNKPTAFKVINACTLQQIKFSNNDSELKLYSIYFTSCGLYKASETYTDISAAPKLQSVYTYSEEDKKCLDITYKYSGGSAFCGYLKSIDTYKAEKTGDEYFENNIQFRRCQASN